MSAIVERVDPAAALARIQAELDRLDAVDLTAFSDEQLREYGRPKERVRRRLAVSDHAFIAEVEARALPSAVFVRSTGSFLRGLLRLDPHEAHQRVRAAKAFGTRRVDRRIAAARTARRCRGTGKR